MNYGHTADAAKRLEIPPVTPASEIARALSTILTLSPRDDFRQEASNLLGINVENIGAISVRLEKLVESFANRSPAKRKTENGGGSSQSQNSSESSQKSLVYNFADLDFRASNPNVASHAHRDLFGVRNGPQNFMNYPNFGNSFADKPREGFTRSNIPEPRRDISSLWSDEDANTSKRQDIPTQPMRMPEPRRDITSLWSDEDADNAPSNSLDSRTNTLPPTTGFDRNELLASGIRNCENNEQECSRNIAIPQPTREFTSLWSDDEADQDKSLNSSNGSTSNIPAPTRDFTSLWSDDNEESPKQYTELVVMPKTNNEQSSAVVIPEIQRRMTSLWSNKDDQEARCNTSFPMARQNESPQYMPLCLRRRTSSLC